MPLGEACEGTMEVGPEEVREICTHLCSQLNQTRFAAYAGVPKCVCVRTAGGACRTMRIATCVTLAKSVFRSLLRTQHCPVIAQGRPVAQLPWRKHSSACLAPRASTKLSVVAFLLLRSFPKLFTRPAALLRLDSRCIRLFTFVAAASMQLY